MAALAVAALGVGAMLAMMPTAGAATTPAPAWSIISTPNPSGATSSALGGVSCTSASACTAVGSYNNSAGNRVTLAERWNGKAWAIQSIPSPGGVLYGVSCTSASACTAVGSGTGGTLAERWNGKAWAIQSTPDPGSQSVLEGVSCTSAKACTAVGWYYNDFSVAQTLAERWNGTTWAIQSTSNPRGGTYGYLYGVSCASASACTAAGYYSEVAGGSAGPLAERWNGTTWAMQSIPRPPGGASQLSGVSCTSASACTAVGFDYYNSVVLAERWNGTTWAIQATPNPSGASVSVLDGVSCTSASACIAVGSYYNGASVTLAERYGRS